MTLVVLLILAGLWAVVLLPPLLRARTERTGDSIGDFNYRLDVLSRTNGQASVRGLRPSVGRSRSGQSSFTPSSLGPSRFGRSGTLALPAPGGAAKRRRDVLRVLLGSVTVTMLLAFVSGISVLWALNVVADALLFGFLALWAYVRSAQAEHSEKLRYLPAGRAPELALRRTGSS